jgi:8-amino-7-oxononanoate synthase
MSDSLYAARLAALREANVFRAPKTVESRAGASITVQGKTYVDMSSNDYLGLTEHPALIAAAKDALDRWGTGAGAARLLTGTTALHSELEQTVAAFKGTESAIVCNSGYQANSAVFSALFGKGDVLFVDKLAHASIIDGVRLCGAKVYRFKHNDMQHLSDLLVAHRGEGELACVVTETVFSMDGDICPLAELVSLKERHDAYLFVDEAHATGVYGARGAGMCEELGLSDRVDIMMGTFSKALGSFGAYIASRRVIIEMLENTMRGYIFSTALPPAVIAASRAAIEVVKNEPERRLVVRERSARFRALMRERGLDVAGETQIVPWMIGDEGKALATAQHLRDAGFWSAAIRAPTVPKGAARIRCAVTYHTTDEEIERFVDVAERFC